MDKKIKLIWDFRGPEAQKTAEHHVVHLNEYVALEKTNAYDIDIQIISEFYTIAYLIIDEKDMLKVRDALKPHRGEVAK